MACINQPKELTTIDVISAIEIRKPMNLSDIAVESEYIRLKAPINLNFQRYQRDVIIVGEKVIVVKSGYYEKFFIFDRNGNFINAFGEIGDRMNEFSSIDGSSWDVSPNERNLIVSDQSRMKLFDIEGEFIKSCPLPWKGCKFYFLDDNQIVVQRNRRYMENDGHQIFIYNSDLELMDSLFWGKSPGLRPKPSGFAGLPDDIFCKLQNNIYFAPSDQDTLFQILPNLKIKPVFISDFGEYKKPFRWDTIRRMFVEHMTIFSMMETKDFIFTELYGPEREGVDYPEETLVFEKTTGDYYTLERVPYDLEDPDYLVGINDDIDGFGFSFFNYPNNNIVEIHSQDELKKRIEKDTVSHQNESMGRHNAKLKAVLNDCDENTTILRIIHFTKQNKNLKVVKLQTDWSQFNELATFQPVRTNHEWTPYAGFGCGMTYDSSDDTFWMVKMRMDSIEHRSRYGEVLPGGFVTNDKTGCEAIAYSSHDSTLWISDVTSQSILHYDRQGNDLKDGFKVDVNLGGFGLAYDSSDSTLWIKEGGNMIWHYSTSGMKLGDRFNVLEIGCNDGRGLTYDPRDNSLWIVNASPNMMIHINKHGEKLPGSFYFDLSLGLPDGVALDLKKFEFWISDWGGRTRVKYRR